MSDKTLRDEFAQLYFSSRKHISGTYEESWEKAYRFADAALKAREIKNDTTKA